MTGRRGLAAVALALLPPAAPACGDRLDAGARRVLQAPGVQLAFAPQPARLAVGRHFTLDIVVCRAAGSAPLPSLRVDADMPAHRHGMNYRPTVQALGGDRFRAEGLLLHMPGRWRFSFELDADGRPLRLTHETDVD
ncbi:MAG: hypothetical protein U1F56_02485 [Rubrivivax sp.]